MHPGALASLCLILAASPLAARDILLNPPIACDLQTDCYIQQYVDHDSSDEAMERGVEVKAEPIPALSA